MNYLTYPRTNLNIDFITRNESLILVGIEDFLIV